MPKESRVNTRIPADIREQFDDALERTGLGETQFVVQAIKALIEYVKERGEITLPLAIIPKSEAKKPGGGASADPSSTRSTDPHKLNEEPRLTPARAALRKMTESEQSKEKK